MQTSDRFEIIPARHWQRDDGKTASLYGSIPYMSDDEKPRWKVVNVGWTIRDNRNGTIGMGKPACATMAEAEDRLSKLLALYA